MKVWIDPCSTGCHSEMYEVDEVGCVLMPDGKKLTQVKARDYDFTLWIDPQAGLFFEEDD